MFRFYGAYNSERLDNLRFGIALGGLFGGFRFRMSV